MEEPPHWNSYALVFDPAFRYSSGTTRRWRERTVPQKKLSSGGKVEEENEQTKKHQENKIDNRKEREREECVRVCVRSRDGRASRIDLPQWLFAQLARNVDGARTSVPVTSPKCQYNCLLCTRST